MAIGEMQRLGGRVGVGRKKGRKVMSGKNPRHHATLCGRQNVVRKKKPLAIDSADRGTHSLLPLPSSSSPVRESPNSSGRDGKRGARERGEREREGRMRGLVPHAVTHAHPVFRTFGFFRSLTLSSSLRSPLTLDHVGRLERKGGRGSAGQGCSGHQHGDSALHGCDLLLVFF